MAAAGGVRFDGQRLAVRPVKLGEQLGGRRKRVTVLGQPHSGGRQLRADRDAGLLLLAVDAL